jgi:translation initiation factor 3 subunit B
MCVIALGQLENGYAIWDFRGQELEKHIQDRFKQFLWRPRPRPLLSKDQQRLIRKNLRDYSRQFEAEDAEQESTVSAELIAHRRRLVDEWNAWRTRCRGEVAGTKKKAGNVEQGKSKEEIEVWVEELIDEMEEIVD